MNVQRKRLSKYQVEWGLNSILCLNAYYVSRLVFKFYLVSSEICLTTFYILLFYYALCLLCSIAGILFAWHGLKRAGKSLYKKVFSTMGLGLNLLALGYVLYFGQILFRYWDYANMDPSTLIKQILDESKTRKQNQMRLP